MGALCVIWGYGGLLSVAADVLGISAEELVEELGQGKTLAEIADEHGVDPQAIVDAFVAQVQEALECSTTIRISHRKRSIHA